jgi:hypothetical protein
MHDEPLPAPVVGSAGGACSVLFTHPIDTMKVRAQAGAAPLSVLDIGGLYKGVSTPLVTVSAHWALLYSGHRAGQSLYASMYPDDGAAWHWQRSFLGGVTAGLFCSVLYTTVQAVKNTVQVHRCSNIDAVRRLWEFGGVRYASLSIPNTRVPFLTWRCADGCRCLVRRGLYRGYLPALAYELPAFSAYFVVYDGPSMIAAHPSSSYLTPSRLVLSHRRSALDGPSIAQLVAARHGMRRRG